MKRYKLLKDLPFAKAGAIYTKQSGDGSDEMYPEEWDQVRVSLPVNEIENLDDWFEEIPDFKIPEGFENGYWLFNFHDITFIDANKVYTGGYAKLLKDDLAIGVAFKTKEEAEKHLEYLKAKQIIKQDANDFEPDWEDIKQTKYYGAWDFEYEELDYFITNYRKEASIYFKSAADIFKSFKNHPKEWKIYLGVEDEEG